MALSTTRRAWRQRPEPRVRQRLKALRIDPRTFAMGIGRPLNEARLIADGDLIPGKAEQKLIAALLRSKPEDLFPQTKNYESEAA